jgi:hypothetical protein
MCRWAEEDHLLFRGNEVRRQRQHHLPVPSNRSDGPHPKLRCCRWFARQALVHTRMQAPASLRQSVGIETRDLTGETGVFTLLAIVIMTWIVLRRSAISKQDHLVAQGQS